MTRGRARGVALSESGIETVCGGIIKVNVDENRVAGSCGYLSLVMVLLVRGMKQKWRPLGIIWMTVCRVLERM